MGVKKSYNADGKIHRRVRVTLAFHAGNVGFQGGFRLLRRTIRGKSGKITDKTQVSLNGARTVLPRPRFRFKQAHQRVVRNLIRRGRGVEGDFNGLHGNIAVKKAVNGGSRYGRPTGFHYNKPVIHKSRGYGFSQLFAGNDTLKRGGIPTPDIQEF
jgi:hypothetical protein